MLVLHALRCAVVRIRINELGHEIHLGDFFQHNCIVNGFCSALAPGERTMVLAEHSWNIHRVFIFESFYDNQAGVLLA